MAAERLPTRNGHLGAHAPNLSLDAQQSVGKPWGRAAPGAAGRAGARPPGGSCKQSPHQAWAASPATTAGPTVCSPGTTPGKARQVSGFRFGEIRTLLMGRSFKPTLQQQETALTVARPGGGGMGPPGEREGEAACQARCAARPAPPSCWCSRPAGNPRGAGPPAPEPGTHPLPSRGQWDSVGDAVSAHVCESGGRAHVSSQKPVEFFVSGYKGPQTWLLLVGLPANVWPRFAGRFLALAQASSEAGPPGASL